MPVIVQAIHALGFASLDDWLASERGKEVFSKVCRDKGGICFICEEANATTLYLRTLDNAFFHGKKTKGAFPICHACSLNVSAWIKSAPTKNTMPPGHRKCTKCNRTKPDSEFGMNGRHVKKWCDPCCKAQSERQIAKGKTGRGNYNRVTGSDYNSRNFILKQMGFPTYSNYLKSALWKEIREKVFSSKGTKCHFCQEQATELHHQRYSEEDLSGVTVKFIYPICNGCHGEIEFIDGGKAPSLRHAKERFWAKERALGIGSPPPPPKSAAKRERFGVT